MTIQHFCITNTHIHINIQVIVPISTNGGGFKMLFSCSTASIAPLIHFELFYSNESEICKLDRICYKI